MLSQALSIAVGLFADRRGLLAQLANVLILLSLSLSLSLYLTFYDSGFMKVMISCSRLRRCWGYYSTTTTTATSTTKPAKHASRARSGTHV